MQEKNNSNALFQERLLRQMRESELNQVQLARISGVAQTTISSYLSGVRAPRMYELMCIANALGVTMDWLAGNAEKGSDESLIWRERAKNAEQKLDAMKSGIIAWAKKF